MIERANSNTFKWSLCLWAIFVGMMELMMMMVVLFEMGWLCDRVIFLSKDSLKSWQYSHKQRFGIIWNENNYVIKLNMSFQINSKSVPNQIFGIGYLEIWVKICITAGTHSSAEGNHKKCLKHPCLGSYVLCKVWYLCLMIHVKTVQLYLILHIFPTITVCTPSSLSTMPPC